MNRLTGKTAIVTGAASGIGKAVAGRFAREGARVMLADYNRELAEASALELNQAGHHALAYQVDVSSEQEVQRMIEHACEVFGTVDILVNAAGILKTGTILETSLEMWNRTLAVNMTGTFLCTKSVLPKMIEKNAGSIINFSSSTGAYHATGNAAAYIASKGGISALTRAVAVDHAKHNIRVNAVCPGPTNTQILSDVSPEKLNELKAGIPLERIAEPDEIANAVLFLASDEASYINGAMISVDGGQTISV